MAIPEPISPLVERKICDTFTANGDREATRALLASYGTEPWAVGANRIRLAVLKLSGGDPKRLRESLSLAKKDWRDVLAWAEYPEQMKSRGPAKAGVIERDRRQYLDWLDARGPAAS